MPSHSKLKMRQKRSPAGVAFDRFTIRLLIYMSTILAWAVVNIGPQATLDRFATGLSAWIAGNP